MVHFTQGLTCQPWKIDVIRALRADTRIHQNIWTGLTISEDERRARPAGRIYGGES